MMLTNIKSLISNVLQILFHEYGKFFRLFQYFQNKLYVQYIFQHNWQKMNQQKQFHGPISLEQIITYMKDGRKQADRSITITAPNLTLIIQCLQKIRQDKNNIERTIKNLNEKKNKQVIKNEPEEMGKKMRVDEQIIAHQQQQIAKLKKQIDELQKSIIVSEQLNQQQDNQKQNKQQKQQKLQGNPQRANEDEYEEPFLFRLFARNERRPIPRQQQSVEVLKQKIKKLEKQNIQELKKSRNAYKRVKEENHEFMALIEKLKEERKQLGNSIKRLKQQNEKLQKEWKKSSIRIKQNSTLAQTIDWQKLYNLKIEELNQMKNRYQAEKLSRQIIQKQNIAIISGKDNVIHKIKGELQKKEQQYKKCFRQKQQLDRKVQITQEQQKQKYKILSGILYKLCQTQNSPTQNITLEYLKRQINDKIDQNRNQFNKMKNDKDKICQSLVDQKKQHQNQIARIKQSNYLREVQIKKINDDQHMTDTKEKQYMFIKMKAMEQQYQIKINDLQEKLKDKQKIKQKILKQDEQFLNQVIEKYKARLTQKNDSVIKKNSIEEKRYAIMTIIEQKMKGLAKKATDTRDMKQSLQRYEKYIKTLKQSLEKLQKQNEQLKQTKNAPKQLKMYIKKIKIPDQKQQQQRQKERKIKQNQMKYEFERKIKQFQRQREQLKEKYNNVEEELKKLKKQNVEKDTMHEKLVLSQLKEKIIKMTDEEDKLDKKIKKLQQQAKAISVKKTEDEKVKIKTQEKIKALKQQEEKLEQSIISKKSESLKYGGFLNRFFVGEVLEDESDRQFIIEQICKLNPKKKIERTQLLFIYPLMKNMNPHLCVDKHPHYVVIVKLKQRDQHGKNFIIAFYSERALEDTMGKNNGAGFVCAVTNRRSFYLRKNSTLNPTLTEYNESYFVFGNSQFRIGVKNDKIDVNLDHNFRYLDTDDIGSAQFFTGLKQEKNQIINYEFYQIHWKDGMDNEMSGN